MLFELCIYLWSLVQRCSRPGAAQNIEEKALPSYSSHPLKSLAHSEQYSFVSNQKRLGSLLWLQGQSLHVLSILSLPHWKSCWVLGDSFPYLKELEHFQVISSIRKTHFSLSCSWLPRQDQRKQDGFEQSKAAFTYLYLLSLWGLAQSFNVFKPWWGNPYWWQDLRVGIACDNFLFRHSLEAKCVKALEMRKGDYSQEGWPTVQIGISKWRCPTECWEGKMSLGGCLMALRWGPGACIIHLFFWLCTCLSFLENNHLRSII